MKKFISVIIISAITAFAAVCMPVHGEEDIYENVIRIHVIANSDSEEDQALKLKVRDALLERVAELTKDCATKAEAEEAVRANLAQIEKDAEGVLAENGCVLKASAEIGEEHYPCREYDNMRFPAGTYTSLRVLIGEAEGANWWCVLFPPLCLSGAKPAEEKLEDAGFTPGQIKILTEDENPKYVLRFKFLEIFSGLLGK